ncbi:MAG: quinone-dependent dihydroorotate dehydrogenase [Rhodospirillaceae bacterium]|jgi:dihydroorotate dehydrogenase|nr:quinone-dependent dihydroorotate dehydrogenase [Rhodospirillaceae bacterium]
MPDLYPLMRPLLFALEAETAHGLALWSLKTGFAGQDRAADPDLLKVALWGREFANPIGLAAGFDKNAEVPDAVLRLGFGFTEVGSITPRPQPGNPRPRLFRLPEDRAVINRMGFNNEGLEAAGRSLAARSDKATGPVGVNFGKNKDSDSAVDDYLKGIDALGRYADYLVVNVSSPNTPGLRALQGKGPLREILVPVREAVNALDSKPPLLLKVAPDLTDEDKADIAEVVLETGIDGLIATNTTIERPDTLAGRAKGEGGGLSGAPLLEMSTQVLADFYRLTEGKLPLVGVGGVASGADAYAKIRAGASLVQLYSALVYGGPRLVVRIKRELAELVARDGFASVSNAVGADHR